MRIPPIKDIKTAIKLYYSNTSLGNKEIRTLFGNLGNQSVVKLKKLARNKMIEKHIQSWNDIRVNTAAAYESWGLSITDLEQRYEKLKGLDRA